MPRNNRLQKVSKFQNATLHKVDWVMAFDILSSEQ